jgi:hypothetical protein
MSFGVSDKEIGATIEKMEGGRSLLSSQVIIVDWLACGKSNMFQVIPVLLPAVWRK